jgi:hypothetical protein
MKLEIWQHKQNRALHASRAMLISLLVTADPNAPGGRAIEY